MRGTDLKEARCSSEREAVVLTPSAELDAVQGVDLACALAAWTGELVEKLVHGVGAGPGDRLGGSRRDLDPLRSHRIRRYMAGRPLTCASFGSAVGTIRRECARRQCGEGAAGEQLQGFSIQEEFSANWASKWLNLKGWD